MTENELKRNVLRDAYANGWAVYHVAQIRHMRGVRGATAVGYPDLTLARDKEVMWFELKQEKGALSPEQVRWQSDLPAYHVIRPSDYPHRVAELLA